MRVSHFLSPKLKLSISKRKALKTKTLSFKEKKDIRRFQVNIETLKSKINSRRWRSNQRIPYLFIAMLHETNVESIAMSQGNKWGVSGVSRQQNLSSIKSNESNFKSIHPNGSSKLDMQDVQERTQRSDSTFTLIALSTFISLVPRAFISLVSPLFTSFVSSGMYVRIFHTLYWYACHLLRNFRDVVCKIVMSYLVTQCWATQRIREG